MTSGVLVNLGCGTRYHSDWVNLDLQPASSEVQACDITTTLPLEDGSCDAVYHSHVLEHIPPAAAGAFIAECRRVLKPGGVIRVVVPDLEQICRAYLSALDGAAAGDASMRARHEWMTIELLDQLVRQRSGGEMLRALERVQEPLRAFVGQRIGFAVLDAVSRTAPGSPEVRGPGKRFRDAVRKLPIMSTYLAGRFRRSGEVHQWMYDRVSLAALLSENGFESARTTTHDQSAIAGWISFELDTDSSGNPVKPDSLYMEARKPR